MICIVTKQTYKAHRPEPLGARQVPQLQSNNLVLDLEFLALKIRADRGAVLYFECLGCERLHDGRLAHLPRPRAHNLPQFTPTNFK